MSGSRPVRRATSMAVGSWKIRSQSALLLCSQSARDEEQLRRKRYRHRPDGRGPTRDRAMAHPDCQASSPLMRPACTGGLAHQQHPRRRAAVHSIEDHQGTASTPVYRLSPQHQAVARQRFKGSLPRTRQRSSLCASGFTCNSECHREDQLRFGWAHVMNLFLNPPVFS